MNVYTYNSRIVYCSYRVTFYRQTAPQGTQSKLSPVHAAQCVVYVLSAFCYLDFITKMRTGFAPLRHGL
jgi:hypothetical protein